MEELTREGTRECGGSGNVLYFVCNGGYTVVCFCQNSQNCTLKTLNFTVYKLYLDKQTNKQNVPWKEVINRNAIAFSVTWFPCSPGSPCLWTCTTEKW